MDKKIMTWTWLCEQVQRVAKQRPEDYTALTNGGTGRFIPGHFVALEGGGLFRFYRSAEDDNGPEMATVRGVYTDRGIFTHIYINLTPTSYRKKFWDRHMPVSFPDGVPKRGASHRCVYHSADGSTYGGIVSMSTHRNDPAQFSVNSGNRGQMLLEDEGGRLVHFYGKGKKLRRSMSDDDSVPITAITQYEYERGDRSTWRNFPAWRYTSVDDTLGRQPNGSSNRDEWLRSIYQAAEAGLLDKHTCLPLAARMWNAAYQFCHNHKDKRAWFTAYKMEPIERQNHHAFRQPCPVLRWKDAHSVVVHGQQELIPLAGSDIERWKMPEIRISYEGGEWGNLDWPSCPTQFAQTLRDPRFISMLLPPHGNPLLYDKPYYAAPWCRTQPSKAGMRGEHIHRGSEQLPVSGDDSRVVQFLERAYHSLPLFDPSKADMFMGSSPTPGVRAIRMSRMYSANKTWEEHDSPLCSWRDYPDAVHVSSNFDEEMQGEDGPWEQITAVGPMGFPATPESATAMVEEAALIDSLPLS